MKTRPKLSRYTEEERKFFLELLARHFTVLEAWYTLCEMFPEAEGRHELNTIKLYFYSDEGRDEIDRTRAILRKDAKRRPLGVSESRQNMLTELVDDLLEEYRGEETLLSDKLKASEQIRRLMKDLRDESELSGGKKKSPVAALREQIVQNKQDQDVEDRVSDKVN